LQGAGRGPRALIILIQKLDRFIFKAEVVALTVLVLSMTGLAALQVLLRNIFNTGIPWADIAVRQMVFWVGFIGGSIAAFEGRHLAVDAVSHYLSPSTKAKLDRFTRFVASFVAGSLAYFSFKFVFEIEEDLTFVVLPIGFSLMSLRFMLQVIVGPTPEKAARPSKSKPRKRSKRPRK